MNYSGLLVSLYFVWTSKCLLQVTCLYLSNSEWQNYKLEYGKSYEDSNMDYLRRSIYEHNKQKINQFNEISTEFNFSLRLNHLSDWTESEWAILNGFKLPEGNETRGAGFGNSIEDQKFLDDILNDRSIDVPDQLDWRQTEGRVTRVKDQRFCGSCWAFASTGALEGQEKVRQGANKWPRNNKLVELSEQNLVDCVKEYDGCGGGEMSGAFKYVHTEGGIDDETSYPYEAKTGKCRFNKSAVAFNDKGYAILPSGDEQTLKQVVAKFGPVAVAIDSDYFAFKMYRSGLYYNANCHSDRQHLDHAMLVVGYGIDADQGDYWIVKNSWSKRWGMDGYIKMARNRGNNCGIASSATIPTFSN